MGAQQPLSPLFNIENYDFFCVNIRIVFLSYDIWEHVKDEYEEPVDATTLMDAQNKQLNEYRKKYAKALHIPTSVVNVIFPKIINAIKANEA